MRKQNSTAISAVVLAAVVLATLALGVFLGGQQTGWPTSDASQLAGETLSYDERNLAVQESMARYAYASMVASITLGVLSTLLSGYAAYLLKKTLRATHLTVKEAQKGNKQAKRLGEAQVRAYLTCVGATYDLLPYVFRFSLSLKNLGNSPAPFAAVKGRVFFDLYNNDNIRTEMRFRFAPEVHAAIAPQGESSELRLMLTELDFGSDILRTRKDISRIQMSIRCEVSWMDVFNKSQSLDLLLIAGPKIDQDPTGYWNAAGEFRVINDAPHYSAIPWPKDPRDDAKSG